MNSDIVNGSKIRVFAGDRDTVIFDPFGTVQNINPETGECEIRLKSSATFKSNINKIGPLTDKEYYTTHDISLYNWK